MINKYPCKYNDCNHKMMIMGYCDEHWQIVKSTWKPK